VQSKPECECEPQRKHAWGIGRTEGRRQQKWPRWWHVKQRTSCWSS
jgi:hypothetical protein